MAFVTFPEKYAREQGMEQGERKGLLAGRLEALELALSLKFGADGEALLPAFRRIDDPERLLAVLQGVRGAGSIDDVRKLVPAS